MSDPYEVIAVHKDDGTHTYVYQCECGIVYEEPDSACLCCVVPCVYIGGQD